MKKLLMALMLGAALAHGEKVKGTGKSVDVLQFDINGIKLGMSEDEVIKILQEKFPDRQIGEIRAKAFLEYIYGDKFSGGIIVKGKNKNDTDLVIMFSPNVLEDKPKELVVFLVSIRMPKNKENLQKLKKLAVDKFGAPVVVDSKNNYFWCDLGGKKKCDIHKPMLETRLGKKYIGFFLGNWELIYAAIRW